MTITDQTGRLISTTSSGMAPNERMTRLGIDRMKYSSTDALVPLKIWKENQPELENNGTVDYLFKALLYGKKAKHLSIFFSCEEQL